MLFRELVYKGKLRLVRILVLIYQYIFKFIVKTELKKNILELLPGAKKSERVSKNGNFVSITLSQIMKNSEEIVYIYEKFHGILNDRE